MSTESVARHNRQALFFFLPDRTVFFSSFPESNTRIAPPPSPLRIKGCPRPPPTSSPPSLRPLAWKRSHRVSSLFVVIRKLATLTSAPQSDSIHSLRRLISLPTQSQRVSAGCESTDIRWTRISYKRRWQGRRSHGVTSSFWITEWFGRKSRLRSPKKGGLIKQRMFLEGRKLRISIHYREALETRRIGLHIFLLFLVSRFLSLSLAICWHSFHLWNNTDWWHYEMTSIHPYRTPNLSDHEAKFTKCSVPPHRPSWSILFQVQTGGLKIKMI